MEEEEENEEDTKFAEFVPLLMLKVIGKKCVDFWNPANSQLTWIFPALAKLSRHCFEICLTDNPQFATFTSDF